MYVDSWGNEYKTYSEAVKKIHQMCLEQSKEDFWEMVSEYLNIPLDIMNWIVENDLNTFEHDFSEEIDDAITNWCQNFIEEIERYED